MQPLGEFREVAVGRADNQADVLPTQGARHRVASLGRSRIETLRSQLLKIGAMVQKSCRRRFEMLPHDYGLLVGVHGPGLLPEFQPKDSPSTAPQNLSLLKSSVKCVLSPIILVLYAWF